MPDHDSTDRVSVRRLGDAIVVRGSGVGRDAGRALLGRLVAEIAGVEAESVRITARCPDCGGDHGRPTVMDPPAARDVDVSLSRVGATIVGAAVRGRRIGVDAESRDASAAAASAALGHATDAADATRAWTRIEAVLKADGRGLRVEPSTVELDEASGAAVPGSARRYDLHDVDLGDELVVSVALER